MATPALSWKVVSQYRMQTAHVLRRQSAQSTYASAADLVTGRRWHLWQGLVLGGEVEDWSIGVAALIDELEDDPAIFDLGSFFRSRFAGGRWRKGDDSAEIMESWLWVAGACLL